MDKKFFAGIFAAVLCFSANSNAQQYQQQYQYQPPATPQDVAKMQSYINSQPAYNPYQQAPVQSAQAATQANAGANTMTAQAYVKQVTNAIMQYPANSRAYLRSMGIDTTKVNMDEYDRVLASGYPNQVYTETWILYTNRAAINNGTFSNGRYYNPKTAAAAAEEKPTILGMSKPVAYTVGGVAVAGGVAAAALSGGGGGGGGGSAGPTDAFGRLALHDSLSPSFFVTTEMQNYPLNALVKEGAHYGYAKGLTGNNVRVGVYDWFDSDSADNGEYSANIVWTNIAGQGQDADCEIDNQPDACGHGDTVTTRLAAIRDLGGMHGMAYKADLMLQGMYYGDLTDLVDAGAVIINTSCKDCTNLTQVQYAKNHNVLVTAAAGNYGGPEPEAPALYASQMDYHLLAVVAINNSNVVTYSDRCGTQMQYCLAAYSPDGTSFASPQVAGAAAMIKEGWSFLSARQIGKILLTSATDIGATGVDEIYGHGILNIQNAVNPIGDTTVINAVGSPSSYNPSSISQNQRTPFGNAFTAQGNANGSVTIIDSFGRDFAVNTNENTRVTNDPVLTAEKVRSLGAKQEPLKTMNLSDNASLSFTEATDRKGRRSLASFVDYELDDKSKFRIAFSSSIDNVTQERMQKFNKNSFVSSDLFDNSFARFSDNNQIFYQEIEYNLNQKVSTRFSTIYSKNNDLDIDLFRLTQQEVTSDYATNMAEITFAPSDTLKFNFRNGFTHEYNSLLGSRFTGSFDMANGSNTYFTGVDLSYDISENWNLFASYNMGMTRTTPSGNSSFNDVSDIMTDSYSVTLTRSEIFGDDSLSFSVGQPIRVRSGSAAGLTQTVDRNTGAVSITGFSQGLTPTGRTTLFQGAYEKAVDEDVDVNVAVEYATEPDHQKEAPAETAVMSKVKYRLN